MLERLKLDTLVGLLGVAIFLSITIYSDTVVMSTLQIDYNFVVYGAIFIVLFTLLVDYIGFKGNIWLFDTILYFIYFIRVFSLNNSLLSYDYTEYLLSQNIYYNINFILIFNLLALVMFSAITLTKHHRKAKYTGRTTLEGQISQSRKRLFTSSVAPSIYKNRWFHRTKIIQL